MSTFGFLKVNPKKAYYQRNYRKKRLNNLTTMKNTRDDSTLATDIFFESVVPMRPEHVEKYYPPPSKRHELPLITKRDKKRNRRKPSKLPSLRDFPGARNGPRKEVIDYFTSRAFPQQSGINQSERQMKTTSLNIVNNIIQDAMKSIAVPLIPAVERKRFYTSYFECDSTQSNSPVFGLLENRAFLGLLTRCKDEDGILEFCLYYLTQGVDHIYIIDDNSTNQRIYDDNLFWDNPRITVLFENNIIATNKTLSIYQKIRQHYQWLIYCDVDEFITTKKNSHITIRTEIKTRFDLRPEIKCIVIPWVMMACNNRETNPKYITQEIIHRWNYNLSHSNKSSNRKFKSLDDSTEVKSIFRPEFYEYCPGHVAPWLPPSSRIHNGRLQNDHIPTNDIELKNDRWDGIHIKPFIANRSGQRYYGLNESSIDNALFVCYHYRILSREHCQMKQKTNQWYKNISVQDMMSQDFPEIVDLTLRDKMKNVLINHHSKTLEAYT